MIKIEEYLKTFDIRPAISEEVFRNKLMRKLDDRGKTILDAYDSRCRKGETTSHEENEQFYDILNMDYESSILFFGCSSGDYYKNAGKWIEKQISYFGKDILDIGCGNGLLTCFIAKLLPDSNITGIDSSENAVKVAAEIAEKLGLSNVKFMQSRVSDVSEKYDTVFSSRTVNENTHGKVITDFYGIHKQISMVKPYFKDYSLQIKNVLKPNGFIVSVENMLADRAFFSYCAAMNDEEMTVNIDTYQNLKCNFCGEEEFFQAAVFSNSSHLDEEKIINSLSLEVLKKLDMDNPQYYLWNAEVMIYLKCKNALKEYELYCDDVLSGHFAVYTSVKKDELYLLQGKRGWGNRISRYDISQKKDLLIFLEQEVRICAETLGNAKIKKIK